MENFRLRVFRAVARHRNFRMAAEELLLTQPAVSEQVKALEQELGTALFTRGSGGIAPTPAGEMLVSYAERLAELAAEAQTAVQQAAGVQAGELTIGASQTISQYLLPRLIASFVAEYPAVRLRLETGNTQQTVEAVIEGRNGIGLIEGPAMRSEVHVELFAEDHMVMIAAATHPWADRHISPEKLKQETLLTREQGSGSRRSVERAMEASSVSLAELRLGLTFDSTEALLSAVEAGLGVAFVSRWAVRNQFALGTLRPVHVDGLRLSRELSAVWLKGAEPGGAAGLFLQFLFAHAERLMPRPTGRAIQK